MCRDTNPGGESPVDLVLMGPSADAGSFGYSIPTKSALESFRQRNSWKADARAVGAGGKVVRYADDYLVLTEPDGTKIVAACRVFGDRLQCRVNEQLSSVVRVGWKFDADDANVIERFVTERALIRQLLDVMQIK